MSRLATLATCQLNQHAMDFEGNAARIIESIHRAKALSATLRTGPELEVTGYGCLDHFKESDTFLHSWEMLERIMRDEGCQDIVVDVGMPVRHQSVDYNCRVVFLNRRILAIRPKKWLCNDGNFREMRYFTGWAPGSLLVEEYKLEPFMRDFTGQNKVPFGDVVLEFEDYQIGVESCEELWTPNAPHIHMSLAGVSVFTNSSGSHHELRKLRTRLDLVIEATKKSGGVYIYANQQGCDGDRLYYDGSAMIVMNGDVYALGSQFSLSDVMVYTATLDLEEVARYRTASQSRALQAQYAPKYHTVPIDYSLSIPAGDPDFRVAQSESTEIHMHQPEEEIALGPACWLWDYCRRSGAAGFFLALSGGIDSCSTAVIVHSMCRLVVEAVQRGDEQVIKDAQRLAGEETGWVPTTPQEFCNRVFHTCFMGSKNSSMETRQRAKDLAVDIGSYHTDLNIDTLTTALTTLFTAVTNFAPRFYAHGGSKTENLALQNIQARMRMVIAYLFAQLLPIVRGRAGGGGLLVLGSANVDECLRGYLTKYDCSSADINPIGGISKTDLKSFIAYAQSAFSLPILQSFLDATPTAELEPISAEYVQSDEVDMGMSYAELSVFGRLRKVARCGPWSMYLKLLNKWGDRLSPREIYEKTRRFFYYYSINRHKMTVLTPSYHAESYSPEDNRFDMRPFLYPSFTWPYQKMEQDVAAREARAGQKVIKAD
ncbi:MAG: glutamine-dependent NAD(+) synthetase [Stictis urceolatum]|nr:glutamine-dependent NAD(+) synthetase [Stictis urceolata]